MSRHVLIAVAALALIGAACGAFDPRRNPQPCEQVFNPVRCLAIRDSAASKLRTTREDVVSVAILPDPTPEIRDGNVILQARSGGPPIELRVTLANGIAELVTIHCGGIPDDPGCFDQPQLKANSVTMGGYHDVPEGSSPVPSPEPGALKDATSLRIGRIDIPIDHIGPTEFRLGELRLPNGQLTEADFGLVDAWPADLTILERNVMLDVRSLVDGRSIRNIYEHGWRQGTERVEAVLIFNVFRFDPGASLKIRDVVVR